MSAHVLVQIKVHDFPSWKDAFDHGHGMRKSHGEQSHQILQNFDDGNELVLLFHWDSLENATSYFEHEALMNSLIEKGLVDKPKISYYDEIEMIRKHAVRVEKFS